MINETKSETTFIKTSRVFEQLHTSPEMMNNSVLSVKRSIFSNVGLSLLGDLVKYKKSVYTTLYNVFINGCHLIIVKCCHPNCFLEA